MTNTQISTEVLKVDTQGRMRVPKDKQEEILAGYESSGMTGRQFAAYAGVKYSTLMSWVGKSRKAKQPGQEVCKPSGMNWVEAVVEDGRERNEEGLSVRIGGGVAMRVVNSHQAGLAVEIIRSLGVTRSC
jgi:hypothetical protein